MHVITTFVELYNSFPHHSVTHGILTLYFTYLTMNISRFHISCIRKTNKYYFTIGGALDHLEHFKRTEQYVNTVCFSRIGVCGLPMNGEDSAHAPNHNLSAAAEIFVNGTYFPNTLCSRWEENILICIKEMGCVVVD
jgi:hypothetical protein